MSPVRLSRREVVRLLGALPVLPALAASVRATSRGEGARAPATTAVRATVEHRGWIVHEDDRARLRALRDGASRPDVHPGRIQ